MQRQRAILGLLIVFLGLLFLGCLPPKKPEVGLNESLSLIGEWVVVEQTTTPLAIIPLCKSIRKGTTVKFTQTTFEVYTDASRTPCNSYAYKTSSNHITFIKADMRWLCTYELMPNSLKVTSTHFFVPDESEKPAFENKIPVSIQAVVIQLRRK